MAITVTGSGRTLIYDGLAQNDVDMDGYKLLNLDTSNLPGGSAPPSIGPVLHQWLKSWNSTTRVWTTTQPAFADISGVLSTGTGGQQRAITELGTIGVGVWNGSVITGNYLARLNGIRFPDGPVNIGFQRLINLADPSQPFDAVTLQYLMGTLPGIQPKEAVKCATTTEIGLTGFPIIDGYQTQAGDRVLVKDMVGDFEYLNGIWTARSGNWTNAPNSRATDCDTAAELTLAACYILNGTANHGTTWIETNQLTGIGVGHPVHFIVFSNSAFAPPGPPGQGVPVGGIAGQLLAKIDGADYNTHWIDPASGGLGTPAVYAQLQTIQTSPTGTTSATPKMMGLSHTSQPSTKKAVITPTKSGKIAIHVAGFISNVSAAGISATSLRVGLLPAPANGAADTGTAIGGVAWRGAVGANNAVPFSLSGVIWNLTVGNTLWIDLALVSAGGALATVELLTVTAYEIP